MGQIQRAGRMGETNTLKATARRGSNEVRESGPGGCGHFQNTFDGGPTLSPSLMSRLGEFGTELFLDCYFSDENPHSSPNFGF